MSLSPPQIIKLLEKLQEERGLTYLSETVWFGWLLPLAKGDCLYAHFGFANTSHTL